MAINLAPETQFALVARSRRNLLFTISGLLIIIVAVVWAVVFTMRLQATSKLQNTQQELSRVEAEIAKRDAIVQRIVLFEQRLKAIDQLLTSHVTLNPLFKEIERLLPPSTVLTKLNVNVVDGSVALTGTTPALDDLAQTLASLVSEPNHVTLFNYGRLNEATRPDPLTNSAEPPIYTFAASLRFDATAVHAARP